MDSALGNCHTHLPGPSPFPVLSQAFLSVPVACVHWLHSVQALPWVTDNRFTVLPTLPSCPTSWMRASPIKLPNACFHTPNASSPDWPLARYTDPCHSFKIGFHAFSSKQYSLISPPSATLSQPVPSISWSTLVLASIPRKSQDELVQ